MYVYVYIHGRHTFNRENSDLNNIERKENFFNLFNTLTDSHSLRSNIIFVRSNIFSALAERHKVKFRLIDGQPQVCAGAV